jgi:5,10-methylenetetrahydromethanopterin reductase
MAKWLREFIGGHTEIVVGAVTVVVEDGQAARQLARREVALYLPVVATLDKTIHIEPDLLRQLEAATTIFDFDRAANLISDELLRRFAFAGTPTDITHQTLELFDAGVNRVEFGTPHGLTATSGLQLLGEKVLPALEIDFGA